jgi:hypothetical protein
MGRSRTVGAQGNFVSEWFGHRVHPVVVSTASSLQDQRDERCPFLSAAIGEARKCIKADAARGVCTISSVSNGVRQDWLVCPYRALNDALVSHSIRQLFDLPSSAHPFVVAAATLARPDTQADVTNRLSNGEHVFFYFDKKTSGELSIPGTPQSPEFSFDVTVIELTLKEGSPHIGRFGILEIQTMDFHGSYRAAVRNLREGLRMHQDRFGSTLQDYQNWLSEGVEGPNIANVFKRTFYQMMFKFQLGRHERCAGCVLAIPQAVWDSWQKHLGAPTLSAEPDGTYSLAAPNPKTGRPWPAWIYVFDTDPRNDVTPSPLQLKKMIGTDAPSISYWALEVAPEAALSNIDAEAGFLAALSRRIKQLWPQLAKTAVVEVSAKQRNKPSRSKPKKNEVPIEKMEAESDYQAPSDSASSEVDSAEPK